MELEIKINNTIYLFDVDKFKSLCKDDYKITASIINIYILSCTYYVEKNGRGKDGQKISFLKLDYDKGADLYQKVKNKLEKLGIIRNCKNGLFQIL